MSKSATVRWRVNERLLMSVPGVGPVNAHVLLGNCPNLAAYHAVRSPPWSGSRHSLARAANGVANVSSAEAERTSEQLFTWPLYAPQSTILSYATSINDSSLTASQKNSL